MDNPLGVFLTVVLILAVLFVIVALKKSIRVVPQAVALIIERLGRYQTTYYAGLHFLIPFVDKVRAGVDLREQVVSFEPQPVITSDNLVVSIDTVIYFTVTDPKDATYEIANYITGIEQLTVTTLRNVIGSMDLSRPSPPVTRSTGSCVGARQATGRWDPRQPVELKAIDPPASVQGSMEQQMRAERDRRAAILTAEGVKQSQVLEAEGEKQSAILRAEGQAQSSILRAQGESRAILQVFDAIHKGDADPKLLAYQYLQMLPQIANGTASKLWVVPTEFTAALGSIAGAFGGEAPRSRSNPPANVPRIPGWAWTCPRVRCRTRPKRCAKPAARWMRPQRKSRAPGSPLAARSASPPKRARLRRTTPSRRTTTRRPTRSSTRRRIRSSSKRAVSAAGGPEGHRRGGRHVE